MIQIIFHVFSWTVNHIFLTFSTECPALKANAFWHWNWLLLTTNANTTSSRWNCQKSVVASPAKQVKNYLYHSRLIFWRVMWFGEMSNHSMERRIWTWINLRYVLFWGVFLEWPFRPFSWLAWSWNMCILIVHSMSLNFLF